MTDTPAKYAAFISYRHVEPDRTWAKRLHTMLETYRTPKSLVRTGVPAKLGRVFRDEEELAASADLSAEINSALDQSEYLIVVCSPRTPESKWVNAEVTRFRELGRHDRILALLIDGEPGDSFPLALCEVRRSADIEGTPAERIEIVEPLAADVRPRAGVSTSELRTVAQLRFAATILGVPFDDLRQRDLQRRLRNARWLAGLTVMMSVIFLGLVLLAWQQRQVAVNNEKETIATLARANYFLADARWKENRVAEALQLLDAIPEEHRKFEWYLARRQFDGSDVTLYGHIDEVYCVAFSPDGFRIASGSKDGKIKLWDSRTGTELRTLTGHTDAVTSVAFSPDGACLASGSEDKTIKLWGASVGDELRTLTGHAFPVYSVAFSPDGKLLASGSDGGIIKLWETGSGIDYRTLSGHSGFVTCVSFSPDGKNLVSSGGDKAIKLWNLTTGIDVHTFKGHAEIVLSVAFSPNGMSLVSGSADEKVKLWDARTGAELRTLTAVAHRAVFSPDGTSIASSGGFDSVIKLWDAQTGAELGTFAGHTREVVSVAFSPDGGRLTSCSRDNTVKIWNVRTGNNDVRRPTGSRDLASRVAFSSDGDCMAAVTDGMVKLWDVMTGTEIRTLDTQETVVGVAFSPDGSLLASRSTESLKLWDVRSGTELRTLTKQIELYSGITFSTDGTRVASVYGGETIKIWDSQSGIELRTFNGHSAPVTSIAFHPSDTQLATGSYDKTLKLWDVRTGRELRTLTGHTDWVVSIAYSSDGNLLASGSLDNTVRLWDVRTGAELTELKGHSRAVSSVAFSPNRTRLASASSDTTIKLWDLQTGTEVRTLIGHTSRVHQVVFNPDGTHLASGGEDSTIKLWTAPKRAEFRALSGHTDRVESAAFSSNAAHLFTEDDSGRKLAWNLQTGKSQTAETDQVIDPTKNQSPDGKLLAVPSGNQILLVDLTFKDDPDEKAYREFKAKPDPWWHEEQAFAAEREGEKQNRYAAVVHLAWLLKYRPEDADAYERLHGAYEAYKDEFARQQADPANVEELPEGVTPRSSNPDDYLPAVVRESLKLPRGTGPALRKRN